MSIKYFCTNLKRLKLRKSFNWAANHNHWWKFQSQTKDIRQIICVQNNTSLFGWCLVYWWLWLIPPSNQEWIIWPMVLLESVRHLKAPEYFRVNFPNSECFWPAICERMKVMIRYSHQWTNTEKEKQLKKRRFSISFYFQCSKWKKCFLTSAGEKGGHWLIYLIPWHFSSWLLWFHLRMKYLH